MPANQGPGEGHSSDRSDTTCLCSEDTSSLKTPEVDCRCPRDDHDVIVHEEACLLNRHETMIYDEEPNYCACPPFETELCLCCSCPRDQCGCEKPGKESFEEWRDRRDQGEMPAVLESTHPLMQKFQESLRRFLEKENETAQQEIIALRDDIKAKKEIYDADLEGVYRNDHDTNGQRVLIEEYEESLANETKARLEAQERARVMNEKYTRCKDKLDADLRNERDSALELDTLTELVNHLEKWREETESDLVISQKMTEKMRLEKKLRAEEKRKLDMFLYAISNDIWKLQSGIELYKKQIEIKTAEMYKITDKSIAYGTELEDLDLDKRRLASLWNSVVANIKHRDNVFDLVREDYSNLQVNYKTLTTTLDIAKKTLSQELEKSRTLLMLRDKVEYDLMTANELFEAEDQRKQKLERRIAHLTESIYMMEKDQSMMNMENKTLRNILESTIKEYEKHCNKKVEYENQMLRNLSECLRNDKAVEAMCNGIRKMRDMSRKLEVSLAEMESKHCSIVLEIEVRQSKRISNQVLLKKFLEEVSLKEKECDHLENEFVRHDSLILHQQREFDTKSKKYTALKDITEAKSPQEHRVEDLEGHIRELRVTTEKLQQKWIRLQGHVVKLTTQYNEIISDSSLISKQIQICDQKEMYIKSQIEIVRQERVKVDKTLRNLRGRLQMLENARKMSKDKNDSTHSSILALTYEYSANLKDAECEIVQLEDDIENLDKKKLRLIEELDRYHREALVWQRKGIQAVDLKRSISDAKKSVGEIGRMKNEIHRMEVHRDHLRRTAHKLSEDLSLYVDRRESALEKSRASAAVEKAKGIVNNNTIFTYKHRLRMAKEDVARVNKECADVHDQKRRLEEQEAMLKKEIEEISPLNAQLEEKVARLLNDIEEAKRQKQWLLERLVRCQRLGTELTTAVKRQSLRIKKPKNSVLAEYKKALDLNDTLRYINKTLQQEYPYLEEKFLVISNTLNIESPSSSPRLLEEATCDLNLKESGKAGCVIPKKMLVPLCKFV